MRALAEWAYFVLCLTLGRLLRAGSYARTWIVGTEVGERRVRKRRLGYASFLVWLGGPLVRILDTGVRVLPQREWEERERRLHRSLRGTSIGVDADGTLDLPFLTGRTLATLLEDPALDTSLRERAIERAVVALARLHRSGETHGDAMAENVMVDLESDAAHWFDFETVHDPGRPTSWRRADDLRALLATCLLRTPPERRARVLGLTLDAHADDEAAHTLTAAFASVLRRPLAFHLGQAPLSLRSFREIGRLLVERTGA